MHVLLFMPSASSHSHRGLQKREHQRRVCDLSIPALLHAPIPPSVPQKKADPLIDPASYVRVSATPNSLGVLCRMYRHMFA